MKLKKVKFPRVTLSVAKSLAVHALLLLSACTDYESDYEEMYGYLVNAGGTSSSSSNVIPDSDRGSSSSVASSSSLKAAWAYLNPSVSYGEIVDSRDNQVYKTVTIGTQTWMAENLNYAYKGVKYSYSSYTSDSTSWCYGNVASNCDKYGRLYTWSAVMDSAAQFSENAGTKCGNGKTCTPNSPHRGICPVGWHVPTNEEYSALYTYIGGSSTAGTMLKSTSGWSGSGYGSDKYGFSVLPAGYRNFNGYFLNEGDYAGLWSASEYDSRSAWYQYFGYDYDYAYQYGSGKSLGRSLRCLKDSSLTSGEATSSSSQAQPTSSSSSVIPGTDPGSSSSIASSSSLKAAWTFLNPSISYGEIVDSRDNQVYKTVTIGTQTWMAENLNYDPGNVSNMGSYAWSGCYGNESSNCTNYGRLYTWEVAMDDASCAYGKACNAFLNPSTPVRGVCPSGWHLPSHREFEELINFIDPSFGYNHTDNASSSTAGEYLKSKSGWNSSGNGTDAYGFSALPGGRRDYDGFFNDAGSNAYFWSSGEYDSDYAFYLDLHYIYEHANLLYYSKNNAYSIRCLKD